MFVELLDSWITVPCQGLLHQGELLLFLALPECVEALLEDGAIAVFLEAEHLQVGGKHVLAVLVRLFPGLDVGAEPVQPLASHFKQAESHLVESNTLELVLGESAGEDVQPHLAVHSLAVADPLLPGLGQLVRVSAPDESLGALVAELGKLKVVSPHLESSLNLLGAVATLVVPDRLQCLILGVVAGIGIELALSPQVEHSSQQLFTPEIEAEVLFLHLHLDRFECPLVPLFDSDAKSELAKSLNSLDELLECVVALGVELAVLEELVHGLLLALHEHVLQKGERQFGDQ